MWRLMVEVGCYDVGVMGDGRRGPGVGQRMGSLCLILGYLTNQYILSGFFKVQLQVSPFLEDCGST